MLRRPTARGLARTAAMLEIPLKDGPIGRWRLNESQRLLAKRLESSRVLTVLKLRQEGITSLALLWLVSLALLNPRRKFAVVLQSQPKAIAQLEIVRGWLVGLGVALEMEQAQRIRLPGGAEIHALSAGAGEAEGDETAANRGEAYAAAVLSEAAYYRNDKALPAIKAAVGAGPILIESTASGPEGFFARLAQGGGDVLFLGVEQSLRCMRDPGEISDEEWGRLESEHGFTSRAHAAWWVHELAEIGGDVLSMLREYPVRPEDPFRVSESMWIQTRVQALEPMATTPSGLLVYARPSRDWPQRARYVITSDVAEGVGGDWSAFWVVERGTNEVVAGWSSNTDETDVLAARIAEAAGMYRPDVTLIEKNGVGVAAIRETRRLGLPVVEVVANEADKYTKLLEAKRYLESGRELPELLVEEARSLRAKVTRRGRYQWIGRKDGLIALGQGLLWMARNPWAPEPELDENRYEDFVRMHGLDTPGYYG